MQKQKANKRAHPDLNQGPADLQSAALTTELCTHCGYFPLCRQGIRIPNTHRTLCVRACLAGVFRFCLLCSSDVCHTCVFLSLAQYSAQRWANGVRVQPGCGETKHVSRHVATIAYMEC